jgi:hypothetical protein
MDRPEPDIAFLSSQLGDEDDIGLLIDELVGQFDGDTNTPDDRPSSLLDRLRSDWSRIGAARPSRKNGPSSPPADALNAAPVRARSTGLLTTFTDRIGGSISLSHVNGRLLHRGTVSLRRGNVSIETVCSDIGLPEQVTRAFEFVAAWFGYPFDSANVRPHTDSVLSWGLFGFADQDLARCLHEWKRQAPDAFTEYCCEFGIDVAGTGENGKAVLSVRSDRRPIEGRAAEWAIATEPRLLAVLARAGRNGAAQRAQVDMAIATCLTPIMLQPWDQGDAGLTAVDILKSPNSIAALLYVACRHGVRTATRLAHIVNERWDPRDEEAWVAQLARALRNVSREHDAGEVLRIWSSPELTTK